MANIAIVNYCNLKCPYCFADDMIHEEVETISLDDYRKILGFISKTPKNHVGIIGGEPTLHPQFEEILKETNIYCRELRTSATLFTNGIELERYLPFIGQNMGLLINCNTPVNQSAESYKKHIDVLDHLYELGWLNPANGGTVPPKANCGCNIFPGCTDYSYMWDIVDKYHLDHIRTSVVSPAACYECWRTDKERYYQMMKPIFLEFCENAVKHHCRLNLDCGRIPMCYFNREETELITSICDNIEQGFCEPVVDIKPDFKATACFGSYDPIDIRDFENLLELERYLLLKKSYPRAEANCTGKCSTCKKHKLLQCQGGCLGFADMSRIE